ncbi:VWA domain-containing protein [Vibrio parahaemolyticus]|nr:VWA domain-containing protein [Vibrio parahaemolyticus]
MENCVTDTLYKVNSPLFNLDSQFSCIDKVPEKLLPVVITYPKGELSDRCNVVTEFRQQLLEGKVISLPVASIPEEMQNTIVECVQTSGLARYCYNNEEVTDALILDLLASLERVQNQISLDSAVLLAKQEQEELERLANALKKKKLPLPDKGLSLTNVQLQQMQSAAEAESWSALFSGEGVTELLPLIWTERLDIWQQLEQIFSDIGLITGLGFNLSKGVFQSHGWLDMVRLNKVIKKLPKLRELIQSLGRKEDADGSHLEEVISLMSITSRFETEIVTPFVPEETKGITRSDSINRMLPQEAALLTNPTLKKLWHIKRAELGLLSYAVEGTALSYEEKELQQDVKEFKAGNEANKDKGPMVICLDTSGSMKGEPENVAKALVLQCLKVAFVEKRKCYLYLFGSKGEVEELELSLEPSGFDYLLNFLCMSFGGGTDIHDPLNMALEKCGTDDWKKADILVLSDGEFHVSSALSRKVANRKQKTGLRVHGVLIGDAPFAMELICNHVYKFSEWIELRNSKA